MRRACLALAGALLLAGCPIPQAVPDYPPGTVTPPRILQASVYPSAPYVLVSSGCAAGNEPTYEMSAQLFDSNNEQVVARWFVNYDSGDPLSQNPIGGDHPVPIPTSAADFVRTVPDLPFGRGSGFSPYQYRPALGTGTLTVPPYVEPGTVRVVELLVSNNFRSEPAVPPFRQAAVDFEVQLHRWVFVLVQGAADCGPHELP